MQNPIDEGNFKWILHRDCEGTEQLRMEISLYQIMFILGNAARTYTVYRILGIFYEEQNRKKGYLNFVVYTCCFLLTTLGAFVNNPSPLMTGGRMGYYTTDIHASDTGTPLMYMIEFIGILALTFFYERKIWKNSLTSVGVFAVFRGAEASAFQYLNETNRIVAHQIGEVALFRVVMSVLLIYAIVFTLVGIQNIRKGVRKTFFYCVFVLLAPCGIGWFLFQILITAFYQVSMYYNKKMILLFGACLWFFWLYDFIVRSLSDAYEKILLKKENQYYESQLKNMEQSTVAWKKLRHDLKNHFIVLKGMLDSGEEEQAKTYLDNFIQNEFGNKQEVQSGNTAIDSILNYKMLEAEQHSVMLDLDVQIPEQLAVSSQAMSVILGNAIDNAIEAARETEERRVSVILQYTKGRLLIQISNPYSGELHLGTSGEYLTGKTEKEDHGFGLKSIKDVVEKSGGVMNIEEKEGRFTLTILLYGNAFAKS